MIANQTKDRILAEFAKELDRHLMSDTVFPKSVQIVTEYENTHQELTVRFDE